MMRAFWGWLLEKATQNRTKGKGYHGATKLRRRGYPNKGDRIRGTLGDLDPLNKVPVTDRQKRVQKGSLLRVSRILPTGPTPGPQPRHSLAEQRWEDISCPRALQGKGRLKRRGGGGWGTGSFKFEISECRVWGPNLGRRLFWMF